ncbi:hypothetical protein [Bradyrhizobium sp. AZCC 1721]|uniref:hypothetical protein n=1 Tax=Bradyrhizobium sp. AZCC 1721 TaxID=3117016 RepID=UPI002FF215EF
MASLHPQHRAALEGALIRPRTAGVSDCPGEFVVVVAVLDDKLLYWSDVEEGWELEVPDARGNIASRGCNQFELRHVLYQVFGDPDAS